MKKWLITLVGLTLALATAGTIMAFTLTGGGSGTPEQGPPGAQEPAIQGGEPTLGPPLVAADDCNDPNGSVAIIRDDGTGKPAVICLPANDTGPSDLEPGQEPGRQVDPLPPIRSDEGIDPNECNLVHNVNACDEDELKAGGVRVPLLPIRSDEADSPVISGGSTLPSGATPQPSLTFGGVKYAYGESFGAAAEGEASVFEWPNARINAEDMELVGTTAQANTHWTGEQRLQGFLRVYRLKGGGGTDVYTFTPPETSPEPECNDPHQGDAQQPCDETTPGYWLRWTAKSDLEEANKDLRLPEKTSNTPVGNTNVSQAHNEPDTEPDVVRQDESAAQVSDIALTAKQTGLPVESVERAMAFQQAFGKYVDELIIRFPDQISGIWVEPVPNTRGHVRFTGEIPPEVPSEIERQGLLDPNNVVLTGGGMISRADHSRRADLATEALVDLEYRNFITFYDVIDNVIRIKLQLPEGASQPSKSDLVDALQSRVRAERDQSGEARFQGRAATVEAQDLELTVITGSGPIATLESTDGVISSGTTSEITPTQTSATGSGAEPAVVSTPNSPTEIVSETPEKILAQAARPVIRLHYARQTYDGVPGNFCWPVAPGVSLCGDEGPFPWRDLDLSTMPVTAGDSIIVEIEADDRPQKLQARIFAEASERASDTAVQVVELDPGLIAPLVVELPAGVYNMRITGQWGVGDQAYKFRMNVE